MNDLEESARCFVGPIGHCDRADIAPRLDVGMRRGRGSVVVGGRASISEVESVEENFAEIGIPD